MKPTWKKYLLYASLIILGGFLVLVGYSVSWTGFGDYILPTGDFVRGKTLWDWLELSIIPLALSIGLFLLNKSERERELAVAEYNQKERALQSYLDTMSELLLEKKLRTTKNQGVRDIARIKTLTTLRRLDGFQKRDVLQFLYEAKLIEKEKPIISLLFADLRHIYLEKLNLMGANLQGTFMQGATLIDANLEGADLRGALLHHALIWKTNLKDADLANANLKDARAITKQLEIAKSLKGATMPDGTKHE